MSSKRVEFPFAYRLTFVPRRGKSERSIILKDSVFVDVPELTGAQAPVAFDLRAAGMVPQPRYDVDGVLYREAHGIYAPELATIMRTKKLLYDARTLPWPNYLNEERRLERPAMMDRLILDEYETIRRDVAERASAIRLRDGAFIYPEGPPRINFWACPGTALFTSKLDFQPSYSGYQFPVTRAAEVNGEFYATLLAQEVGAKPFEKDFRILGDASRMTDDCRSQNAYTASEQVRHYLGQRFASATPEHMLKVADLVDLGDRVRDDVSLLPALKAALSEMAEAFPTTKSPVRRHAAIGLAAIEMAERFHSEDMMANPAPRIGR